MSKQYHYNFAITKDHPYVTEGWHQEESFNVLRRALADGATAVKIFNMADDWVRYKDPVTGNTYIIKQQD